MQSDHRQCGALTAFAVALPLGTVAAPLRLAVLTLGAIGPLVLGPSRADAQQGCSAGAISEVEIRTLDPYDEESSSEDARLGWALRALNWLHVETRERVVRWELLFSVGSCLDPLRLSETERELRSLPFLKSASVTSERLADGTHRVEVVTRDRWAIAVSVGVDLEQGLTLTGLQGGRTATSSARDSVSRSSGVPSASVCATV